MESRSYRASNLTRVFEFSVFSMEGRRVRRDKAKKGEKKERKRSDSKVGRSARFRRARRAGHSSILASRADGLSLPLPLRPFFLLFFLWQTLRSPFPSLSLPRSEREISKEKRFLLGSFGFSRPSAPTTLAQRLSTTLNSDARKSSFPYLHGPLPNRHRCLTRETFSGY